jgi:hypothetical protein
MRHVSEAKPSSNGAGRGQAKPARPAPGAEAFGRFVRNLARLEGKPGASRKDKEGHR